MKWCVLVLVFAGLSRGDNAIDTDSLTLNCMRLNSQEEIDLDKIMGKWYVVEILEHRADLTKPGGSSYVVDSCPIVKLKSLDHSSLKLLWTEEAGNLEYNFRIPEISKRSGLWQSTSLQNGTLAEKQYNQFVGTVHVMKAVASDMVLTFCSRPPNSQLYSLLLAREHTLQKSDKRGVHNLLGRRGLKIVSIRETCVNGGATGTRRGALDLLVGWATLVGLLSSSFLFKSWQ
ncbi:PREDICTED: uncharacterized protein LOC106742983 [Dinoponera quadriceps]|uniref:Uncharacterized protein LOC106742983 n=1 Tax=Dinoponera quadriceps TaxID=609295 RepID=A0A6P3X109_DINQU|nr:PREDICTED: uncharacterized protein LOC106742983 [Dinoponera quadriceps]